MKKKIYLTGLGMITVLCVVIGTAYHMSGMNTKEIRKKEEALEAFENLIIESDIMNISIVTGNAYTVTYTGAAKYQPVYEVKDGTLTITQKNGKKWFQNNGGEMNMVITIPQDTTLRNLDVESDIGMIKMENTQMERGHIESDMGEVILRKNCFTDLEVESDIGNVVVDCEEDLNAYSLKLRSDIGEITMNHEAKTKSFYQEGNSKKNLTITTDIGNIDIRGNADQTA